MRKGELIFNYTLLLAPFVMGLAVARSIGIFYADPRMAIWIMVIFFVLGFILFAKAKFSIINQGQLFTFGPSLMSRSNCIIYFLGYGLMGLGLLLFFGFSVVMR